LPANDTAFRPTKSIGTTNFQLRFETIGPETRKETTMKTILAALVALAVGGTIVAPTQAASLTITTGDGGQNWRDNDRWSDNGWHDNGRHLGWHKHGNRHSMRRAIVRECEVTTQRYWRDGELIVERTKDCD